MPVVGCKLEDPWEVNDPESRLIIQVDPNNKDHIIDGVLAALSRPKRSLPRGIEKFYFGAFSARLHDILTDIVAVAEHRTRQA